MTRWRLDISYDGANFSGWARQPHLRTVQGELETWIPRVLRLDHPTPLTVAGRTDSGVHARGQVAHVDLPDGLDPRADLHRRLARVLDPDLVVREITEVPSTFDARFSALWRRYVYRVWDADSVPDPLLRSHVVTVRERLDLDALNSAGQSLLGLRDFAAFCKHREGATTIRTLMDCHAVRRGSTPDPAPTNHDDPLPDQHAGPTHGGETTQDCMARSSTTRSCMTRDEAESRPINVTRSIGADEAAGTIEITVLADAFCHSMVRSLVGALTAVASGKRDQAWLDEVMTSSRRHSSVLVMPAAGLTLEEVGYPDEDGLAARAAQARARRSQEDLDAARRGTAGSRPGAPSVPGTSHGTTGPAVTESAAREETCW